MPKGLHGRKVVIGGGRKIEEISTLIEKQGGIPISRPLQGTVFLAEKEVEPSLRKLVYEGADLLIFTTGIGFETLLRLSKELGFEEAFLHRIKHTPVASRGYKTLNALRRTGIKPVAVDEDGTTQGLIRGLEGIDLSGKHIIVQLHGESAPALMDFLKSRGAAVETILPYQHIPPEQETIDLLCQELLDGKVDAVCFTTKVQVHSLFAYAREKGISDQISYALKSSAVPVAVGKVTAEALREEGINEYVIPEHERMGAMIVELSNYFDQ
ncbi:uroporphyrinogen-III synthase [Jeotgalibacillus proteolyticus]|uniref:Uroporphyrinogen-III synthase n=1 Tax=Jeotgalibacillus proteolyticus TaxID=2082395 RepID=A0A2S5GB90_9BACL|nr:uroporphyrinogen-III synthase [Jeotgalibacillus proteolyticus]PPA70163.1 uroporphyrinogen-III synthase [Jeotgalibacillus proteolyticus]